MLLAANALETHDWAAVLVLASLSVATTVVGVWLAVHTGERPRAAVAGIGFSAGTMVVVSVVELLPEAHQESGTGVVVAWALAGALTGAALHVTIPHLHLSSGGSADGVQRLRSAYLVMFGLILHDFPEGFALATSYANEARSGVLVAVAIAAHNLPEEFAMAMPAVQLGRRRLLVRAAVVSALAEPMGALIGLIGVSAYPGLNAGFLAFAAGVMIFVAANELLPMARRLGNRGWFWLGVVTSILMVLGLQLVLGT